MRYAEFKLTEAVAQPSYYTVGDSHSNGVSNYGRRPGWKALGRDGSSAYDPMHPAAIKQIPKGSVVVISLGANDLGSRRNAGQIAGQVANIVSMATSQGLSPVVLLPTTTAANKPQDPRRDELIQAIKSAVSVPTIPLGQASSSDPQGVHLDSGGYANIAQKVLSVKPVKAVPQQGSQPAATGKFSIAVPEVSVGRRGAGVMDVQKALQALGYDLGPKGTDGIRGKFTIAAIKKYQTDKGLKVDGDAGPETVNALNKDIAANPDKFKSVTNSSPADVNRADPKAREIDTKAIQDPEFNSKLDKVAKALGIESDTLRRIIKFETAGTFSPTSQDPSGVSIGLIGFTRPTAKALGTSREELAKMTAVEQLDYVYKFYKMNRLRPGSDIGTMYMITFMPAYAYSPDNTVLGQKNGGTLGNTGLSLHKIWLQNPAFAKSKGKDFFTVGDVKNMINSRR